MQAKTRTTTLHKQSTKYRLLRLFAIATAATIMASAWMAAKADPPQTIFYSGTYQPLPNGYSNNYRGGYYPPGYSGYYYVPPQPGYSYPMGPAGGPPTGPVIPPYLTTLPSAGYYAPAPNPYYGYTPPSPVYSYPYPAWVPQNSVYYSGPAGGGGTITSNSTVTNNGGGISFGKRGWNVNLGNTTHSSSSNTTVTTHR